MYDITFWCGPISPLHLMLHLRWISCCDAGKNCVPCIINPSDPCPHQTASSCEFANRSTRCIWWRAWQTDVHYLLPNNDDTLKDMCVYNMIFESWDVIYTTAISYLLPFCGAVRVRRRTKIITYYYQSLVFRYFVFLFSTNLSVSTAQPGCLVAAWWVMSETGWWWWWNDGVMDVCLWVGGGGGKLTFSYTLTTGTPASECIFICRLVFSLRLKLLGGLLLFRNKNNVACHITLSAPFGRIYVCVVDHLLLLSFPVHLVPLS